MQIKSKKIVMTENKKNVLLVCDMPGYGKVATAGLSGNLVGISINLCKSIQKELFINDTP